MPQTLREIYRLITNPPVVPDGATLRSERTAAKISLRTAADQLNTWPIRLSRLERQLDYDNNLAARYEIWLSAQRAA